MIHLFQQIFYLLVIIGFVSINDGACWHIKGVIWQRFDIAKAAISQKTLNGLSIFGDHQVHFQPIEIPFLAGDKAPKLLLRIEPGSFDTNMITYGNRQAVNHIDGSRIQGFPDLSSELEQEPKEPLEPVQSAAKAAFAQHVRDIAVLFEHRARTFMIASKT